MDAAESTPINEYLQGNFAPIDDERDAVDLDVTGAIPPQLSGMFVRNGPNPRFDPLGAYHWFDGDGMLHRVALHDGKASYRNRWIKSKGMEAELKAGRALYGGMSNPVMPDPELVGDEMFKHTANTNVVRHANRILCLMEASVPVEVTPDLETVGLHDFGGKLQSAMTAHPHIDGETGEMFFFGYVPTLKYHHVSASGELLRSIPIDVPRTTMMHDFMVSERHAIFFDAPAVMNFEGSLRGEPLVTWQPEHGTRIGVLARDGDGSDLRWYDIDACYCVHFLNAWDEGDKVVVLGCRFDRMDFGASDASIPDAMGFLTKFTIDPAAGTVSIDRLADLHGEFPRVNPATETRRNRYGYLASVASGKPKGPLFDSVTKYDINGAATETTHVFGPGQITGEAVFAPDPTSTGEDDGWLLSLVHDENSEKTDLVILDAHTMKETARVHMPRRVPYGFHANWFPAEA